MNFYFLCKSRNTVQNCFTTRANTYVDVGGGTEILGLGTLYLNCHNTKVCSQNLHIPQDPEFTTVIAFCEIQLDFFSSHSESYVRPSEPHTNARVPAVQVGQTHRGCPWCTWHTPWWAHIPNAHGFEEVGAGVGCVGLGAWVAATLLVRTKRD